jgi:hypothetical protein
MDGEGVKPTPSPALPCFTAPSALGDETSGRWRRRARLTSFCTPPKTRWATKGRCAGAAAGGTCAGG